MANKNLSQAKTAKNDEFYTQLHDIEKEMQAYLDFNPDVFRGKTILLPCDDPEWSNFTKYFAQNFQRFGLKKLISTSFAPRSKRLKTPYLPGLFETEAPQFDASKTQTNGKIFVLHHDETGDGKIDINDLRWSYLQGETICRPYRIRTNKHVRAAHRSAQKGTTKQQYFLRAKQYVAPTELKIINM